MFGSSKGAGSSCSVLEVLNGLLGGALASRRLLLLLLLVPGEASEEREGDRSGEEMGEDGVGGGLHEEDVEGQHAVEVAGAVDDVRVVGGGGKGFGEEEACRGLEADDGGAEAEKVDPDAKLEGVLNLGAGRSFGWGESGVGELASKAGVAEGPGAGEEASEHADEDEVEASVGAFSDALEKDAEGKDDGAHSAQHQLRPEACGASPT